MNLAEIRVKVPELAGLDDAHAVDVIHQLYYPSVDRSLLAGRLGVKPAIPEPAKRNPLAVANDTVIEAANAAAGGVSAVADFVAPGNRVSQFIDENFIKAGEESQSDVVKAEKRAFREEVDSADGIGGELAAVGRHVVRNPLLTAAQAVGSFAGPGLAIKGAQGIGAAARLGEKAITRTGLGAGAATGAAMAGGDAGGNAYDLVQQTPDEVILANPAGAELAQQGLSVEQIKDQLGTMAARDASVLPAIIGAAGGMFGAERLLAGAGRGGLARAPIAGVSEAAQEGVEEGVTQFEGQRAASAVNPAIDPTKGVAAAAGLGAVMGGAIGAGVSALTPADQIRASKVPEGGPLTRAANAGIEAQAQGAEAAADSAAASETAALDARLTALREQLADPVTRETFRSRMGQQAFDEAVYYSTQAERADVPARTRDNLLQVAERLLSSALEVQPTETLALDAPLDQALIEANALPQIGLDTAPSGTFTVDSQGNAAPQTQADAVSARQRREEADILGQGVPRGAPAAEPDAPLAIELDTSPTGTMLGGAEVRPETQADRINREQRQAEERAETQRKEDLGITPDIDRIFKNRFAANRVQKQRGGEVVPVDGGFVVRPESQQGAADVQPDVPVSAGLAANPSAERAPVADGGVGDLRPLAADAAGRVPDAAAAPELGGAAPVAPRERREPDPALSNPTAAAGVESDSTPSETEPAATKKTAPVETWAGRHGKGMLEHAARTQLREQKTRRPELEWTIEPAPEFGPDRFKLEGRDRREAAGDQGAQEEGSASELAGLPDGAKFVQGKGSLNSGKVAVELADGRRGNYAKGRAEAVDSIKALIRADQGKTDSARRLAEDRASLLDQMRNGAAISRSAISLSGFSVGRDGDMDYSAFAAVARELTGLNPKALKDSVRRLIRRREGVFGGQNEIINAADALKELGSAMREPVTKPLSAAVERSNKKTGEGQTEEEAMPGSVFSRSQNNILDALAENDELFALPKSDKTTVEGVTADNDPQIKVSKNTATPGETRYTFTMPDGKRAAMSVRKPSPYGPSLYAYDLKDGERVNEVTKRPGDNPEDVDPGVEDVWIDVSALNPGGAGARIYNIAATYAHNTGRIFIGDPAGLSDEAMRRRAEHMLSSALKFGTTDHIAPHPRQVNGDAKLGVPALKWVYGDHEGNIRRLIDLNLAALDNAFPTARNVGYDIASGQFTDATRRGLQPVSRGHVFASVDKARDRGVGGAALAGGRTVARGAVFRALLREEGAAGEAGGQRDGLLARLASIRGDLGAASPAGRIFYSRGNSEGGLTPEGVKPLVDAIRRGWANAPEIVVVRGMADEAIPRAVRDADAQQRSQGASGDPEGFFYDGKVYLVASELHSDGDAVRVLFHEALGHFGLRSVFGKDLATILDRMSRLNAGKVRAKARQYGLNYEIDSQRRAAAEEVLAEMAQATPEIGWVKSAIAAIRSWLREHVPGFSGMRFTDAELIRSFLMPAREFVQQQGRGAGKGEEAVRFSRSIGATLAGAMNSSRDMAPAWATSAALKSATSKIDTYAPTKPIGDKVREMSANWKEKFIQGVVDSYAPLKKLSIDAYIAARMVKSADGAFEGMLLYGKPKMDAEGAITGELDGKGFLGAMQELGGEHDRFFMWVAGNRAKRLLGEGRENLFTAQEVDAMTGLSAGKMADGSSRPETYRKAAQQLHAYNKSVLDIAEKTGLIDGESRAIWETEFYVPFYRVANEGEIAGPAKIKGLVRQKAFERLKGGKENLGDLMDNTLRNWSHLLSASLANQAASKSLLAAEKAGIALEAKEVDAKEIAKAMGQKGGAVYFMDAGLQRWFVVEDPQVLDAITSMEAVGLSGLPMKLMGQFKRFLTVGVTISPAFKIRNLIRDTVAAPAMNDVSFNVFHNLATGWKATSNKSDEYAQMLFGGGMMRFGTFMEGDRASHVKRLIEAGVKDETILNTPQKLRAALTKVWDGWQDFGDRMENVNRAALYKQLLSEGASHREAAFKARDMMDFSLQGSWPAMRILTQVVPFLNARAQGLYKMGRGAKEDPRRMAYVVGAVSLASIALMLAYQDDDDWKAREDWDRDTYWWIKIGETAYRIPKPFEVGAFGTLAERSVELMVSDEMTGKRFGERMKQMLSDTFAMNPVPQLFKPMIDLYANKDSFTGRAIESRGMENLSKSERSSPNTTALAKALGSAGDVTGLSPVQIDHMIRAYFGWLGTMGALTVDAMASPFTGSEKPARKLDDFTGGMVKSLPAPQSRYVTEFYDQARAVSEVMADIKRARESGDMERARELTADSEKEVQQAKTFQRAQRQMSQINANIRRTRADVTLSAEQKRERLDQLTAQRNELARRVRTRMATP